MNISISEWKANQFVCEHWVFFIEIDIDALYWLQMGYTRYIDVVNNMSPKIKWPKIGLENIMNWMHE